MSTATRPTQDARVDLTVWSTTATLVITDPDTLDLATAALSDVLAEIERACSRFRPDSEINRILADPGRPATLSPILNAVIGQSLRVAAATGYLVDPTVAAAVIAAGYDRDIADVLATGPIADRSGNSWGDRAPGAWHLTHDPRSSTLTVPPFNVKPERTSSNKSRGV